MIFPGRKPLLENIPVQTVRVDDLLREFAKQNFSGYAEFLFPEARGILLFHSGEIITAVYKDQSAVKSQEEAVKAVKNQCRLQDGSVSTYLLPGEMAHMLRGLCNRKLVEEIHLSGRLHLLLDRLKEEKHTGTLDLIFTDRKEKGMILLINGRISNTYLEMEKNLTLEGKDALARIRELLDLMDGNCRIFQSDFSQEIWKSRRGTRKPHESRIYQILTEAESAPSLQPTLLQFVEKIEQPLYAALLDPDGTPLAEFFLEKDNRVDQAKFCRLMQEVSSLFSAIQMGALKEILCTSEDKNLLIRTLSPEGPYLVLVLERNRTPKDLRNQILLLDKQVSDLCA